MTEAPPKTKIVLAQVAVALMIAFVILGFAWYGFSAEVRGRMWRNLLDRPAGPMTFRFILQPVMATIAAFFDGLKDARIGRSPYLLAILADGNQRVARLREGVIATSRVLILGLVMDGIYQFVVFDTFHPGEAVVVALLLAFVPYLLLRGPIQRLARMWVGDALR